MRVTTGLRGLCAGLRDMKLFYTGQGIIFTKVKQAGIISYNVTSRNISQENTEIALTSSEVDLISSRKAKISKAMKAYLQRSVEHKKFMNKKITEYEIGKRHLANMMGEDPETFTQNDINEALKYLLPSGLFEPRARPQMNHPLEDYQREKKAEFDESGRPFHTLFYTGMPKFFTILQEVSITVGELNLSLSKMKELPENSKLNIQGSKLVTKLRLEEMLLEKIDDKMFEHFQLSFERLTEHPLSASAEELVMKYREPVQASLYQQEIRELMHTEKGVPYMTSSTRRKTCFANVTVYGQGSGKITVNGTDILYFKSIQDREQILFPLQFSGMLRSVDVEATVEGGGHSGQAGAIRYGIAEALKSFVPPSMTEKMRIAGLLTKDVRKKERKKPGQRRARAKFTWKKR